jgi:hypothetical protein
MNINCDPQPKDFHVVLHFGDKSLYLSTYTVAYFEKHAIEVAQANLSDHVALHEVSDLKPSYATVSDGGLDQIFVNYDGEWLELAVWRSLRPARYKR